MTDEPDYDPVDCPVADCSYADVPRSVAAHVSGTDDGDHDWGRLPYDGARAFVMDVKREQLAAMDADVPGVDSAAVGAVDGDATAGDAATTAGDAADADAGTAESDAEADATTGEGAMATPEDEAAEPLDTTFARDAVAVASLLRRYGTRDLAALDTFRLVNLYALLSDLESAVGDARGQVRDALLADIQDDRSVAADFGEVNRNSYESLRLKDERTVREALEAAGVDPAEVSSVDSSKVRDAVEAGRIDREAVFDAEERTRIRRVSVAEERREELLAELDPDVRELLEVG